MRGLLLPGERKSIEPLAERVAAGHEQERRHFVSESEWDDAAIEAVLWEKADRLLGAEDAFLIIDDTRRCRRRETSRSAWRINTAEPSESRRTAKA